MHGLGVMRTADGYEYIGIWKDDEMNGEFMTCYTYGMKEDKVRCEMSRQLKFEQPTASSLQPKIDSVTPPSILSLRPLSWSYLAESGPAA